MDLVRGNEGERCALNIVLPPSIDLDQDLGRGEMGRASGQRQLCHAHTHRPERYLGTFRTPGWQKLCEGTRGLRRKVWTQTKILSPNIRYFVAILRLVAVYALFGNL